MYLKRLQLHGFKSFASRTSLEFSPGITAIVGPNGSGKSNLADSLRWVLGEQNMRQLRGKKSEDIIFAGGHGRAPLGMSEVTLTLDNSSNWLPSEYTEVTVTRRAFRSGESDYLINGAKVRLKDVLTLLSQARIGHDSYTIIGQGLVDQALSARAEERRGLFEDAAGIRHFQAQRNDAEQRLHLTQTNLSRLHDILGEIEPRLGPLAEQARRAREYITARAELDRLLRQWFGLQWNAAHQTAARTENNEQKAGARVEQLRSALGSQESEQKELRERRNALLGAINDLRRQRGEATAHIQALERDLAVAHERAASVERSRADLSGEQESVRQSIAEMEARVVEMEEALAATDETIDAGSAQLAELESAIHRARQQQEREEARLRNAQRDAMQAQARVTAAQSEMSRLRKQHAERQSALDARRQSLAQVQARAEEAQARLDNLRVANETQRAELGDRLIERESTIQAGAEAQAEAERLRLALADCQRERRSFMDRLQLLQEWAASHGDPSAALEMFADLPEERRPNVLGIVAQLIQVPPEYDAAVEAALGPFLHAVIAASEDDAWLCADALREHQVGRVVVVWPTDAAASSEGTIAHLIGADTDPAVASAIASLLHNMRIAAGVTPEQLRWELHGVPIVTLTGEIAHPDGWLVAGQAQVEAGESTLVRARELRALPEQIDAGDTQIQQLEMEQAEARAQVERLKTRQQALDKDIKTRETRLSESAKVVGQAQREAEKVTNEAEISRAVEQQLATELLNLEQDIAAAETRLAEAETLFAEQNALLEEVQAGAEADLTATRGQQEELERQRTALAVQRQEQKALSQRIEATRAQARELAKQAERREERMAELERQTADVNAAMLRYTAELEEQRGIADAIKTQLQAQESDAAAVDKRLAELEKTQAAERVELTQAETDYRKASLDAQRARDAIESLQAQMVEEMGEEDASRLCAGDGDFGDQLPPPDGPVPEEMPKMRRQIDSLRGRLKSLGGYDPEAPQVYEELKTRYEFLTAQVRDMEEALARLRAVIMELDTTMRRRFEETFHAVNERFRQHFITLFQGGAARLELTAPKRATKESDEETLDDEAPEEPAVTKRGMAGGVEIYVQIPGKKVQDLSLLSGGERAMVSAALLFALLETNPPPFCLLDEVDAALDESNVVRFCEILEQIANQTQFIVITHNRVTMTHSNALYGVSMTDSVSRILSMRLAEAQSA